MHRIKDFCNDKILILTQNYFFGEKSEKSLKESILVIYLKHFCQFYLLLVCKCLSLICGHCFQMNILCKKNIHFLGTLPLSVPNFGLVTSALPRHFGNSPTVKCGQLTNRCYNTYSSFGSVFTFKIQHFNIV